MKKFAALLLSLMLLAMPFAGLADMMDDMTANNYANAIDAGRRVTTTISVDGLPQEMTGDAAADQMIHDLVNSLRVSVWEQEGEEYFVLGVKQEDGSIADLLSMGFAVEGTDLYLASNLLGANVIVVGLDDVQLLGERLIDMFTALGMFTEDDAAQMKAAMPELAAAVREYVDQVLALAGMQQNIDFLNMDFNTFIETVAPIFEKVQTVENPVLARNCDAAESAVSISLTSEDVKVMLVAVLKLIKSNADLVGYYDSYMQYMVAMDPSMAEMGSFSDMFDQLIAEAEAIDTSDDEGTIDLTLWLDADGAPVAAQMDTPADAENAPAVTYGRLTLNDGVAHSVLMHIDGVDMSIDVVTRDAACSVVFAVAEEGETLCNIKCDATTAESGNVKNNDAVVEIDVPDENEPVNIKLYVKDTFEQTGVDFADNLSVKLNVNDMDICTFHVEMETSQADASIKAGNVIRPAALTEAEFANWFVGVYNSLYNWLFQAIEVLPASVTNMMF